MFTCQDLKTLNGDNKKGPERGLIFRREYPNQTVVVAEVVSVVVAVVVVAVDVDLHSLHAD